MKLLAENCLRTNTARTMTKVQAAQQQLEGAIANLFLGNWACAVTLSGAAENVMPKPDKENDLFCVAQKVSSEKHNMKSKDMIAMFNEKRDWLKHHQTGTPQYKAAQDFSQEDAVIMILRAYTRFLAITNSDTEHIVVFEEWFRKHYPDYLGLGKSSNGDGVAL